MRERGASASYLVGQGIPTHALVMLRLLPAHLCHQLFLVEKLQRRLPVLGYPMTLYRLHQHLVAQMVLFEERMLRRRRTLVCHPAKKQSKPESHPHPTIVSRKTRPRERAPNKLCRIATKRANTWATGHSLGRVFCLIRYGCVGGEFSGYSRARLPLRARHLLPGLLLYPSHVAQPLVPTQQSSTSPLSP